jgi:hypothetical protein
MKKFNPSNAFALIAVFCLVTGAASIYRPAGLIVAGLFFAGASRLTAQR